MAQFDFFGTWEDSWRLLQEIIKFNDVTFVPDLIYDSPEPIFINTINEEAKEYIKIKRHLYIWGKLFSKYPPLLLRRESGPKEGTYYVQVDYSGPSLELILPACFEENGLINLNTGMVTYSKEYLNPESGNWENPSKELKDVYKNICTLLKKSILIRYDLKTSYQWIGKNAVKLLQENKAQIIAKGV